LVLDPIAPCDGSAYGDTHAGGVFVLKIPKGEIVPIADHAVEIGDDLKSDDAVWEKTYARISAIERVRRIDQRVFAAADIVNAGFRSQNDGRVGARFDAHGQAAMRGLELEFRILRLP